MNTSDNRVNGRNYWRSLDQLENTPEFQRWAQAEFPEGISEEVTAVSRRGFLTLMGASMALAGLTGCIRRPEEHILPYSKAPEDVLPGIPNYYATAFALGGDAFGVLVESHEGRPTKIEGNPDHPASLGATDVFAQASVLQLYDPDRMTKYLLDGKAVDRSAFLEALRSKSTSLQAKQGAGLRFLSEANGSPTMAGLKQKLAQLHPQAVWHTYEPISSVNARAGARMAFGQLAVPVLHPEQATVILAVDSDFLASEPDAVRNARKWADRRRLESGSSEMNRLYAVEGIFSLTGAMADHRLRLRSSQVDGFLRALAAALVNAGLELAPEISGALGGTAGAEIDEKWLAAVAGDLSKNRGSSLIVVGRRQPPAVHALAHALNSALGNVGRTVTYAEPTEKATAADGVDTSFAGLVDAMKKNQVDTLVILGGNPAYDAPADTEFGSLLKNVPTSIRVSMYEDETSKLCKWLAPRSHYLESWSDVSAMDGTASIVQPLIDPLYLSVSDIEVVSAFAGAESNKGYDLVRAHWQGQSSSEDFEKSWRQMLHEGVVSNSASAALAPALDAAAVAAALSATKVEAGGASASNLEVVFTQDAKVFDGRFANNGWLQELPDPMTKLTWDNAALMSPATAAALNAKKGTLLTLSYRGRSLTIPAWVVPGMADFCVALPLGYGRTAAGRIGTGPGFNAYLLRDSAAPDFGMGMSATATGETYQLATTQEHGSMENRPLVREATVEEYRKEPHIFQEMAEAPEPISVYASFAYEGQQWGLAVDLNVCTGCSTCVIACQAENNIPVVGKERVLRGREMHWMRLDRYFSGDAENAGAVQQPMLCQQCENAPCEAVCPVAATSHSKDGGLNDMVYNRCIGTRYCSNNCPFKVRRFNYFNYHEDFTEVEKMQQNPDVTVRMRGVMEKCTYCVQRINSARREMKLAGKDRIADGTITPACAQACPVQAIVFGDVNDPESRVSRLKARDVNYPLLAELNVKPRTSYLARLRNPNPELA